MAKLELRELQTDDAFLLSEIIDKMEIDIDIDAITKLLGGGGDKGKRGNPDARAVGIQMFGKLAVQVVRRIHRAQDEVRQLVANMSGLSVDEVRQLPVTQLIGALRDILAMDGALDFLPSASE